MKALLHLFKQVTAEEEFKMRLPLGWPRPIRSLVLWRVKKPETINYRTFGSRSETASFAPILGPIKDYECLCGKDKRLSIVVVPRKCGVEVTLAKVRRDRMGHIELASPVAHIWFLKSLPFPPWDGASYMTLRDIERVLYFEAYVVTDPGMVSNLQTRPIVNRGSSTSIWSRRHGDQFQALMGAEGIREMLRISSLIAKW